MDLFFGPSLAVLEEAHRYREARAAAARAGDHNNIQDDAELERRWLAVPYGVRWIARRDALLHALLNIYARWRPHDLEWLAKSYLSAGWERVWRMLAEMGTQVELWRALWPKWKEPAGSVVDQLKIKDEAARCIGIAAHILEGQTRIYSKWLALRPPPPIVVSKKEWEAIQSPNG